MYINCFEYDKKTKKLINAGQDLCGEFGEPEHVDRCIRLHPDVFDKHFLISKPPLNTVYNWVMVYYGNENVLAVRGDIRMFVKSKNMGLEERPYAYIEEADHKKMENPMRVYIDEPVHEHLAENQESTSELIRSGELKPKIQNTATVPKKTHQQDKKNFFEQERNYSCAFIRDFSMLPRFVIDTPTMKFDSHGTDTTGWELRGKQKHFEKYIGPIRLQLIYDSNGQKIYTNIRLDKSVARRKISCVEDFLEIFGQDFQIEQTQLFRQVPRSIDSYSEEELLAEVNKRIKARLNGYRIPSKTEDNVIDFEEMRRMIDLNSEDYEADAIMEGIEDEMREMLA